jgi:hypothetical protein
MQDLYRDGYARGLDFMAITDHSFGRESRGSLKERIDEICYEADRFNRPGEFVTIPAGETHYLPVMHMNIYFNKADPDGIFELVNSLSESTRTLRKQWKEMNANQLSASVNPYWDAVKADIHRQDVLLFPHHTMWLGIKPFVYPDNIRVIEVYSTHGTSEIRNQDDIPVSLRMKSGRLKGEPEQKCSARELLDDGMHLGFVGGSDNHDGQVGFDAITGVFTSELSRESLFQAIYNKHCYATSSNRSLFEINQTDMGYHILVAGDGEIDTVELICNGENMLKDTGFSGRVIEFDWTPPHAVKGYFYVKVTMEDGHESAWSSPVWF